VPRDKRNTQFFWILLVILAVVVYYGGVWAGTSDKCGSTVAEKWVWTPPPHWECVVSFGP
jgi:hypothetical protein